MTAIGQNFIMSAGDTVAVDFTLTEADGVTPLDLTGASVKWRLARAVAGPALVSKDLSSGIVVTDAPGGLLTVTLLPDDTAELGGGRYYHEAEVTDAIADVSTVAVGTAVIRKALIP